MQILFFVVSLISSIVGAICGIGGGIVIKPALDMLQIASVSTISFLSGCTVLSMSCYSVCKTLITRDRQIDLKLGTPLAIGAALGGAVGQHFFVGVKALFPNANTVGAVQSICLFFISLGTFVYTLRKDRIRKLHVTHVMPCTLIGLLLGILSSFLGIGGGPINLVVLGYCFSMRTKIAAQNSLYIILFSQIANLLTTVFSGIVPPFEPLSLMLMVAGGILGGVLGRIFNRKMDNRMVDRLFLGLTVLIMIICLYNALNYILLK